MTLVHSQGVLYRGPISIKRGIIQGDSLFPLLFTVSLKPLSTELKKTGNGYKLDEMTTISHLFYIGKFKLYQDSDSQLTGLINMVKMV